MYMWSIYLYMTIQMMKNRDKHTFIYFKVYLNVCQISR